MMMQKMMITTTTKEKMMKPKVAAKLLQSLSHKSTSINISLVYCPRGFCMQDTHCCRGVGLPKMVAKR